LHILQTGAVLDFKTHFSQSAWPAVCDNEAEGMPHNEHFLELSLQAWHTKDAAPVEESEYLTYDPIILFLHIAHRGLSL